MPLRLSLILLLIFQFINTGFTAQLKKAQDYIQGNQLEFIENKGQLADVEGNLRNDILFYASGGGKEIYLRKTGLSFVLARYENANDDAMGNDAFFSGITAHRIDIDFSGANINAQVKAENKTQGYHNFYYGHCSQGITNVAAFMKIIYENIYPNIDIVFYGGKAEGLKYDIVVKKGANPADIKFVYKGADAIIIDNQNQLHISNSISEIIELMPKVYQVVNGKIKDVPAHYIVDNNTLSFDIKKYSPNYDLIIDPWVTYYGGTKIERGDDIDADGLGNVVVSGRAMGTGFPTSAGAYQSAFAGAMDIFVLKMDASGNRLWATYFGGTQYEHAYGIVCDASNNIGVTGYTNSPDFPVTAGAFQVTKQGTYDAYVLKLDAAGARVWCTFIGGSGNEDGVGYDIVSNAAGDFAITGNTKSNDFPCSSGAFQNTSGGGTSDSYVALFTTAGARLWSTYVGGSGREWGAGITFDNTGNIIAVGNSDSPNFPTTAAAFQPALSLGDDAYMIKFSAAGNRLWATYMGGTGTDYGSAVTTDSNGDIIFTGWTNSLNFPCSAGAYQLINNGIFDCFFSKFTSAGARVWSTYFGGVNNDESFGVAVDANADIYFFGDTYSPDYPVTSCAYQTIFGGDEDFYVTKFSTNGTLICSGFLGDAGHDEANSNGHIVVDGGYIYVAASTPGPFPVTPNAYQNVMAGGNDAIIAKLCANTCGGITPAEAKFTSDVTMVNCGTKVNFNDLSNICDTTSSAYEWSFPGGNPSASTLKNPSGIYYNTPGSYPVKLILSSFCGGDTIELLNYINVDSGSAYVDAGPNQTIMLGGIAILKPNSGASYQWTPTTGLSCDTCKNPFASPEETTMYYVTITHENGCVGTDSVLVNVQVCFDDKSLFIPNTFTPNGDALNEGFKAYGNDIYTFNMKIFNRWGNKIFESNSIDTDWDGKVNGQPAMEDVYVYRITYSSACSQGNIIEETGHVIILK